MEQPVGFVSKVVKAVGGPADGQFFAVQELCETLLVPVISPYVLQMNESDPLGLDKIIAWDSNGPRYNHDILQARYKISGDVAVYEEEGDNASE